MIVCKPEWQVLPDTNPALCAIVPGTGVERRINSRRPTSLFKEMKVTPANKSHQFRVIFTLIVLLLFARSAVAFHDSIHADLISDHCQVAQLEKNTTSALPTSVASLQPYYVETADTELAPQLIQVADVQRFLIRAPPFSSR